MQPNAPSLVPSSATPIERLILPFQRFARIEAAGGIVLLACTAIALVWANSPWQASYDAIWHSYVTVDVAGFTISKSLLHWVSDGLMAIFFFVVGLEIKRELLVGELASLRQATLPMAAAIGGMVAPAICYAIFNAGGDGASGWGVPMATDIAFALGVLALLGKRVPVGLKVFLTALAIVDDLGAVLVIAIFYTDDLSVAALGVGGVVLILLVLANALGVRRPTVYLLLGLVLWVALLKSGVHATVAGVLVALTIPARTRIHEGEFKAVVGEAMREFEDGGAPERSIQTNERRQEAVHTLEKACELVQTPLMRFEHALLAWVAFLIMPVFALANAGVALGGNLAGALLDPIAIGIVAGLVVGKQIGIMSLSWLAVKTGLATLPAGVRWLHVYAASWLAGIGFTMSLFIGGLAFKEGGALETAKIGVLAGSLVAGVVGFALMAGATKGRRDEAGTSEGATKRRSDEGVQ